MSCVVITVKETAPAAGFLARVPAPEHVNVVATAATSPVTVRVRAVAEVAATVTVPEPDIAHAGGDPLTNTGLSAVIVIVSATSAAPLGNAFNASGVIVNRRCVGMRPTTNSFDVAAEVNATVLRSRVV